MPVAILRHGKAKYEVLKIDNLPSTFFDANAFLDAVKDIHDLDEQNIVDLEKSIEHWLTLYP
jgi:hypothetical protein